MKILKEVEDTLKVFTTRCDTLYGVTFMVLSPEHPFLEKYADKISNLDEIKKYQEEAKEKSEMCIFTGIYTDIGDEQSISQSLSTFSAHIYIFLSS